LGEKNIKLRIKNRTQLRHEAANKK